MIYDPQKHIVEYEGMSIDFYCGPELTEEAINILKLYFGIVSPQDAFLDNMLKCHKCRMLNNG